MFHDLSNDVESVCGIVVLICIAIAWWKTRNKWIGLVLVAQLLGGTASIAAEIIRFMLVGVPSEETPDHTFLLLQSLSFAGMASYVLFACAAVMYTRGLPNYSLKRTDQSLRD